MIKRRGFLKALTVLTTASSIIPATVLAAPANSWAAFNPNHQYGDVLIVADVIDKELLREVWHIIGPQIRHMIPPEYRGNISFKYENPKPNDYDCLCQRGMVGWKYTP